MVGLLVLAGGVLGGLALLGLILANEKTRSAGVALIGIGVALVVALGFVGFQSRQAAMVERRATVELAQTRAAEAAARAKIEAEQALEKLTEPKIKIEPPPPADAANADIDEAPSSDAVAADGDDARPRWLTSPPKPAGQGYLTVLDSGPYATIGECKRAADAALLTNLNGYLQGEHGLQDVATQPGDFGLTPKQLRDLTVRDRFVETIDTSIGAQMQRVYLLMEIDEEDGEALAGRLQQTLADRRRAEAVKRVGLLAGGVLGVLSLVFGLLKVDEATRGYYTKRLFLGVPAAIIALVAAGLLLVRS